MNAFFLVILLFFNSQFIAETLRMLHNWGHCIPVSYLVMIYWWINRRILSQRAIFKEGAYIDFLQRDDGHARLDAPPFSAILLSPPSPFSNRYEL